MRKNHKPGSIKISLKAHVILAQYRTKNIKSNDLVFPDLDHVEDFFMGKAT